MKTLIGKDLFENKIFLSHDQSLIKVGIKLEMFSYVA